MSRFAAPIAEAIWDMKYRLKEVDGTPIDQTVETVGGESPARLPPSRQSRTRGRIASTRHWKISNTCRQAGLPRGRAPGAT